MEINGARDVFSRCFLPSTVTSPSPHFQNHPKSSAQGTATGEWEASIIIGPHLHKKFAANGLRGIPEAEILGDLGRSGVDVDPYGT